MRINMNKAFLAFGLSALVATTGFAQESKKHPSDFELVK